jgi:predicted HTH transcriptional regulator
MRQAYRVSYSQTAFRESLANALIHRDYTRPDAVLVQWSEEQLEVASSGGFPSGGRVQAGGLVERTGRAPMRRSATC